MVAILNCGPELPLFQIGGFARVQCGFLSGRTPLRVRQITEFDNKLTEQECCLSGVDLAAVLALVTRATNY
jgi:hypothetical protein